MKAPHPSYRRGLTLVEVLAGVLGLMVLAAVVLPALMSPRTKAPRVTCVLNLKNIGLALRIQLCSRHACLAFSACQMDRTSFARLDELFSLSTALRDHMLRMLAPGRLNTLAKLV